MDHSLRAEFSIEKSGYNETLSLWIENVIFLGGILMPYGRSLFFKLERTISHFFREQFIMATDLVCSPPSVTANAIERRNHTE